MASIFQQFMYSSLQFDQSIMSSTELHFWVTPAEMSMRTRYVNDASFVSAYLGEVIHEEACFKYTYSFFMTEALKFYYASELAGGFSEHMSLIHTSRASDSESPKWSIRTCIPNKFPGNAVAADLGAAL